MAKRFDGKSILVSGAASGIGRATALAFGAEGGRPTVTLTSNPGSVYPLTLSSRTIRQA